MSATAPVNAVAKSIMLEITGILPSGKIREITQCKSMNRRRTGTIETNVLTIQ
jgi:hypothetical protein